MRAESAAAKARASEAEADAEAEARERARLEADMGEAANMVPSNTRPCVKLLSISAVSCHASRAPRLDRISGSCARDRRCICRIVTRQRHVHRWLRFRLRSRRMRRPGSLSQLPLAALRQRGVSSPLSGMPPCSSAMASWRSGTRSRWSLRGRGVCWRRGGSRASMRRRRPWGSRRINLSIRDRRRRHPP